MNSESNLDLVGHLEAIARRNGERAALLRRYGFSDLAAVYADGTTPVEAALERVGGRGGEPPALPTDASAVSLPHRGRMRALTRLVRGDMSENRAWSRRLARLADAANGVEAEAASNVSERVALQAETLNARLRARLSVWAAGGAA